MTYWGYHLLFTLPMLVVLFYLHRRRLKPGVLAALGVICAIAFLFTTPWDNYAVWLGIWGFGENVSLGYPVASLARSQANPDGLTWLGHIPIEEYAFFIIETMLVCLVALYFLPGKGGKEGEKGNGASKNPDVARRRAMMKRKAEAEHS